jgi:hypothetical protein
MTTRARLIAALGLSIGLHLGLLILLGLGPRPASRPALRRGTGGVPLRVCVEDWRPRRAAAVVSAKEYIKADVDVGVGAAPVVSEASEGPGGVSAGPASPARASRGMLSVPGSVRRVVYLIDRSGSMALSGGLGRARDEVCAALEALPADASFQILIYNQGVRALRPASAEGLIRADVGNVEKARAGLEDIHAAGSTNHAAALRAALYLRPDVLFLLTDADDLTEAVVNDITRLNRGRSAIHVADLSRTGAVNPALAALARRNGGTLHKTGALP